MGAQMTAQLIPALAFGSVSLLIWGLLGALPRRSARLEQQLTRFTGLRGEVTAARAGGLSRQRRRMSTFRSVDKFLERQGFTAGVDRQLASAALPLRVGEYLLIRWGAALALAIAAMVFTQMPIVAAVAGVLGYMLPAFYVHHRQRQRANELEQQLVDALALMAGGLRAGYSFLQGAEAVVRELPPPIRDEFGSLLEDLRVGVPMEEAVMAFAGRVRSEEVDMLATAILIQRSSGGNLAEILDTIAYTIRERLRIRREIMTLTAQERISSYIVGALPIGSFVFLSMSNPKYLSALFDTDLGHVLLVAAGMLEVIGFVIIRKIIDIKI
jgi:tight adherence protein B